jgi:hypothetical protein
VVWFGTVCGLLADRIVNTVGNPRLDSVAGLGECQTPPPLCLQLGIKINLLFRQ